MRKPPVTTILLDYGGVIAEEGFQNGLRGMAREQGIDETLMMDVARLAVYDTGFILGNGDEAVFWGVMREGTGLQGDNDDMTRRVLDGFILRDWVIERVRQWRQQGVFVGILSDQCHWLDRLNARDNFFAEFDYVYNSYYGGKGKRDPTLFNDIATELQREPHSIVLVDDMQSNIDRARAAGWQGVFYADDSALDEVSNRL